MKVDYRETLITYLRSEDIDEAAKSLGVSKAVLNSRLYQMKKRGVNIPKKSKRQSLTNLEVAQLNSIVKKYLKEQTE